MTLQLLLSWWNLIYLVPLILALVYLVIYMVSGVSFGDADASPHIEMDADADVDADTDADADHDASAEHDAEHEAPNTGSTFAMLSLLGVGKAPLSILVMMFLMIWSITGMIVNRVVYGLSESVSPTLIISIPAAAVAAVLGTGLLARLIARVFPSTETYIRRKSSLVGLVGEAVYDMTTGFGMVQVRDESGDLHELPCETRGDAKKPAIQKGQRVVLYDYDEEKGVFYVTPFEPEKQ